MKKVIGTIVALAVLAVPGLAAAEDSEPNYILRDTEYLVAQAHKYLGGEITLGKLLDEVNAPKLEILGVLTPSPDSRCYEYTLEENVYAWEHPCALGWAVGPEFLEPEEVQEFAEMVLESVVGTYTMEGDIVEVSVFTDDRDYAGRAFAWHNLGSLGGNNRFIHSDEAQGCIDAIGWHQASQVKECWSDRVTQTGRIWIKAWLIDDFTKVSKKTLLHEIAHLETQNYWGGCGKNPVGGYSTGHPWEVCWETVKHIKHSVHNDHFKCVADLLYTLYLSDYKEALDCS